MTSVAVVTPQADAHSDDLSGLLADVHAGRLSSKFLYAGNAANLHLRYGDIYPAEYDDGRAEHEAATLARCFLGSPHRQVCDIGMSNGVHTVRLIGELSKKALRPGRILGLDYSRILLDGAQERLSRETEQDVTVKSWDLESGPTSEIEH